MWGCRRLKQLGGNAIQEVGKGPAVKSCDRKSLKPHAVT